MLSVSSDNILINGSVLPTAELVRKIQNLKVGQTLKKDNVIVAARLNADHIDEFKANQLEKFEACQTTVSLTKIDFPWHIFSFNEGKICAKLSYVKG